MKLTLCLYPVGQAYCCGSGAWKILMKGPSGEGGGTGWSGCGAVGVQLLLQLLVGEAAGEWGGWGGGASWWVFVRGVAGGGGGTGWSGWGAVGVWLLLQLLVGEKAM